MIWNKFPKADTSWTSIIDEDDENFRYDITITGLPINDPMKGDKLIYLAVVYTVALDMESPTIVNVRQMGPMDTETDLMMYIEDQYERGILK
nr:MAG TPA: hypothetical protein [Caudoviricetes sp.]